jgi:hypothetical protein
LVTEKEKKKMLFAILSPFTNSASLPTKGMPPKQGS